MIPIESLTSTSAGEIKYVLTDIDDTLTENGRLNPEAFAALLKLNAAGLKVFPVTGRPAGWCDMIARQWPVDGVVGENGAFVFFVENGRLNQFHHPSVADSNVRSRLDSVREDVLVRIPRARVAKDQFSRMYDLAIDFAEEPPYLDLKTAEEIKAICEAHGAKAKISSIHVNTWFGDYDKLAMSLLYLHRTYAFDPERDKTSVLYFGDSPNDEPMFRYFPISCGVANIAAFTDLMTSLPTYVTSRPHGEGFAEAIEILLRRRKNP